MTPSELAVVSLNFAFALFNAWLCWQLWRWRSRLRQHRQFLQQLEPLAHEALVSTTLTLRQQRNLGKTWRSRLYQLQFYVSHLGQLLRLLQWLQQWLPARWRSS